MAVRIPQAQPALGTPLTQLPGFSRSCSRPVLLQATPPSHHLTLQGLDGLGGGRKSPYRHPVLKALGRAVPELSAVRDLGRALEFPQLGAEVIGRGHSQGLE